jgi:hypothetical protein
MKKISILAFLVLTSTITFAQIKAFGVKAGLNYSSTSIKETYANSGINWDYVSDEAQVAPVFGVFARVKILPIFFQPELLLSDHKTTMRVSSINLDSLHTLRQNRFDLPLLFGYSKKDRLRAYIGPVYTRILQNKVTSKAFREDELGKLFENGTWAVQLGVGFDLGPIVADIRYETSLGRIRNEISIGGYPFNFDHRNNVLQVTLGWDFVR